MFGVVLAGLFLSLTACDNVSSRQEIFINKTVDIINDDFTHKMLAWKAYEGDWTFEQGELTQHATDEHFPVIIREDREISDLDVSVRFKPLAGEEDASGGIIFRAKNAGNYYVARVNALEQNFNLYVFINWHRSLLATVNATRPELKKFISLRVVAKGNHIQAYLNDELKINHYDDAYKSGYTGLWTKSDSVSVFDDFKVLGAKMTSSDK